MAGTASAAAQDPGFHQVNLVSDLPGVAALRDPDVRNPWGIAMGPKTPLWVNNNFNPAGNSPAPKPADLLTEVTLYAGANGKAAITKIPLEVRASSPTGIVFNPSNQFVIKQAGVATPARFLFNEAFINKAGTGPRATVTGWSNVPAPAPATTQTRVNVDPGFHSGLTLVPGGPEGGPLLLAADLQNGRVQVYDGTFRRVRTAGLFVDPGARAQQLSPYNVAYLDDRVYVSYAAAGNHGGGAVSVFDDDGMFMRRLVTGGKLNDPWGMAVAPERWGRFGGALLVGNVDDGTINAFDRRNGHFMGTLTNGSGKTLVNPGLWGISFGNGTIGTPRTLLFAAGIGSGPGGGGTDVYEHGLVGLIKPNSDHR